MKAIEVCYLSVFFLFQSYLSASVFTHTHTHTSKKNVTEKSDFSSSEASLSAEVDGGCLKTANNNIHGSLLPAYSNLIPL